MVRCCSREQVIKWHLAVGKTVFEADKKIYILGWPAMDNEEKEIFLKNKKIWTEDEEKEFIKIWANKYGIKGKCNWLYEICRHHKSKAGSESKAVFK